MAGGPTHDLEPLEPRAPVAEPALPPVYDAKDRLHHTIACASAAFSVAVDQARGRLFVGTQSGLIAVWDLETYQLYAHMLGHADSVLSLLLEGEYLFSASCTYSS